MNKKLLNFQLRDTCRLCSGQSLLVVFELPATPLANEFINSEQLNRVQEKFPLYLEQCKGCGHIQLPVVVDPDRLFRNYVYVSGTSKAFVGHFNKLASDVVTENAIKAGSLVVEIGSNDGTALKAFRNLGMRVIGVDPAIQIASFASANGIPTLPAFFSLSVAQEIKQQHGTAALVVANNVFAHADDLGAIVDGIVYLLDPVNGCFVFEVQYLPDMLEHAYFDMIYHEHLSYHTIAPLVPFLAAKGLSILDCRYVPTHGGSIRISCGKRKPTVAESSKLLKYIESENDRLSQYGFPFMKEMIGCAKDDLTDLFVSTDRKFWGFGAPAKLTTLFYSLGLNPDRFIAIIDENPLKQGLFTPGVHLPVVSFDHFHCNASASGEDVMVFAWNFSQQIKQKFENTPHRLHIPLPRLHRLN